MGIRRRDKTLSKPGQGPVIEMETVQFKRRMPKIEKIPLMKVPGDISGEFGEKLRLDESRSVFVIRDFFLESELDGSLEKTLLKVMDDEKLRNYKKLRQVIIAETDIGNLFNLLSQENNIGIKTHIYKRLVDLDPEIYTQFLEKLKTPYSEECYDSVFLILGMTLQTTDISPAIIEFLRGNYIRDPADFASMIQLLGYGKGDVNLQYMYTYYHFFIDNFEDEHYYEGPVIGMANYFSFE
jgi:hypothetical protein